MSQVVQMQSTPVTVKTATQQVYVLTEGGGDRKRPQAGSTKLIDSNNIKIYYNAEIKDISCCTKLWLCCHPCYCGSTFDVERSYLYIRENSLDFNSNDITKIVSLFSINFVEKYCNMLVTIDKILNTAANIVTPFIPYIIE